MPTGAPDYYKRILLYGLYDGEATPLACDEQGRLVFITELVSPFDKSGTILLRDSFECGLIKCAQEKLGGPGAAVAIHSDEAIQGGHSCKLTGGSATALATSVIHRAHPSEFNVLGLEWFVRWATAPGTHWVQIKAYTGEALYTAIVQYDWTNNRWRFYEGGADWTILLDDIEYSTTAYNFHRFKLTIDIEAGTYKRFVHPGGVEDMSAYNLIEAANTDPPVMKTSVEVHSMPGSNGVIYVDGITLTQDDS